ncbi:MAG: DoxX family protein [Neisseriaceae bacterium]|nr:DoxX family protein [Neisseriaceae bacterium]MBP6861689.1 DoxX family protein [Neisseriaceae bacterium]
MKPSSSLAAYQPHALGLIRIVLGYTIMLYGLAKTFAIPYTEQFANVPLSSIYGIAGVVELVGGFMLLVGFKTRVAAFILSGQMAFAYFMGHASASSLLFPVMNGGSLAVVLCFTFLYFVFAGSGKWALDNK